MSKEKTKAKVKESSIKSANDPIQVIESSIKYMNSFNALMSDYIEVILSIIDKTNKINTDSIRAMLQGGPTIGTDQQGNIIYKEGGGNGMVGVLDNFTNVISKLVSIVKNTTSLQISIKDLVKFKYNTILIPNYIDEVLKLLQKTIDKLIENDVPKIIQSLGDVGENNDSTTLLGGVGKIIDTLNHILSFTNIKSGVKSLISFKLWRASIEYMLKELFDLYQRMNILINYDSNSIKTENIIPVLDNIQDVYNKITNTLQDLEKISGVKIKSKQIVKNIESLNDIIKFIVDDGFDKINRKKLKKTIGTLNDAESLIKEIVSLVTMINISIPVMLVGLIALPIFNAIIFLLIPVINSIILCVSRINGRNIREASKDLLSLSLVFGSFVVVSLSIVAIGALIVKYHELMIVGLLGAAGLLLASMAFIFVIKFAMEPLQKLSLEVLKGFAILSALLIMTGGVALVLIGISKIMALITWDTIKELFIGFISILGLILVIGLAIAGIGALASAASIALIAGAIAILSIITVMSSIVLSLFTIKTMLESIQNMEFDKDKLEDKIEGLFKSIYVIVDKTLAIGKTKKDFKPAVKVLRQVNKITRILKRIINHLNDIDNSKLSDTISLKVSSIFDIIFGTDGVGKNAIVPTIESIGDLINKRKTVRRAKRLLRQVGGVTEQLKNIVEDLNSISKFNLEESVITESVSKIFRLVNHLDTTIEQQMIPDSATTERAKRRALRQDRKKMRLAKKALSRVDEVLLEIVDVVDGFNKIRDFKIEESVIKNASENIFGRVNELVRIIDGQNVGGGIDISSKQFKNKLDVISDISEIIRGFVPSEEEANLHKSFIDENIMFIDKINNMDINKLKASEKMFEKMAKFSESIDGNFEKMADSLNEKIAPLMEELRDLLEKVPGKIDESTANISASTFAAHNPGLTVEEHRQQYSIENPNASNEDKVKIAQQRMINQMNQHNNEILSKFDELIELFKNGTAQMQLA